MARPRTLVGALASPDRPTMATAAKSIEAIVKVNHRVDNFVDSMNDIEQRIMSLVERIRKVETALNKMRRALASEGIQCGRANRNNLNSRIARAIRGR